MACNKVGVAVQSALEQIKTERAKGVTSPVNARNKD
jgi:hypothetical protein